MTATTTHTDPTGGQQAGTDALFYARAVLADLVHFDDDTIRLACKFIWNHPDTGIEERDNAVAINHELRSRAAQ
ncbi:hypothetical protein [Puniceibacterium sp. IMCC21224]|uniref:hypothetical protein n=1 Tax=Puniceibacterium sp. IMCC21224 TaxID=1618204 RepID=UPI00064D8EA2|nr:hypothetical protein [Puniceibacterium sp. IMCC21224]KMK63798.1 hypothetical protein IMCC21224_1933 [Puniceibacterium sp. IMCC21224]